MSRPTCPHCGGFIVVVIGEDEDGEEVEELLEDEEEGECVCGD